MKNAAKFWRIFPLIFVLQFPGKLATINFTQIPPHIRTSNSTRLNQNSFTAILWELVGPRFSIIITKFSVLRAGLLKWLPRYDSCEIVSPMRILMGDLRIYLWPTHHPVHASPSPKAGHPKAGRSDFRNQRFESDTGKTRKMQKVSLTLEKQGSEEIPKRKNAENAENAENADTKMRKMRMTGFNMTGFRWPPMRHLWEGQISGGNCCKVWFCHRHWYPFFTVPVLHFCPLSPCPPSLFVCVFLYIVKPKTWPNVRKVPDTLKFLRHAMRAILSVWPQCSHRCVSLKESPLKTVLIRKHATKRSTEHTSMWTKCFKHIAI